MLRKLAFQVLEREEGFREKPYYCSEGYPTIGIGQRIGPKGADLSLYQVTVTRTVAGAWLAEKTGAIIGALNKHDFFSKASESRQVIFVSMAYQMGVDGLLSFSNMIRAAEAGDWEQAAVEALDSRWHRQTTERAERHAEVLKRGTLLPTYQ